jgi:hypothetical protein
MLEFHMEKWIEDHLEMAIWELSETVVESGTIYSSCLKSLQSVNLGDIQSL